MRIAIVLSERGRLALGERVALVQAAAEVERVVVVGGPWAALRQLPPGVVPYLIDVNRVTAGVAAGLVARKRPFVLDTGDDPAALARATRGSATARVVGAVDDQLVGRATGVVCRGSFHQPMLRSRTAAPVCWAPDTVPDELLDAEMGALPDGSVIGTFGSAGSPPSGDRAYGWEIVDLVAGDTSLRGVIVVAGPGIESLRARAQRKGVADRVVIEGPRPLFELRARLSDVAFVTSVQSDDSAGWVRTTGKLPVALGMGKAVVTTRVGEATRVLPDDLLVDPGTDEEVLSGMAAVIGRGLPPGWPAHARRLAERFRRTIVAAELRGFLDSL